jgi:hypothetical protein
MFPRDSLLSACILGLALLLDSASARADDACPSLSGCSYQAGHGLAGNESASRQTAPPELRPPVILNSCDAGGCLDSNGTRYNGRAGESGNGVYLDPQGRRCARTGDHLQCG